MRLGNLMSLIGKRAFSSSSRASHTKKPANMNTLIKNGARKCASVQPSVVPPNQEMDVRTVQRVK